LKQFLKSVNVDEVTGRIVDFLKPIYLRKRNSLVI